MWDEAGQVWYAQISQCLGLPSTPRLPPTSPLHQLRQKPSKHHKDPLYSSSSCCLRVEVTTSLTSSPHTSHRASLSEPNSKAKASLSASAQSPRLVPSAPSPASSPLLSQADLTVDVTSSTKPHWHGQHKGFLCAFCCQGFIRKRIYQGLGSYSSAV